MTVSLPSCKHTHLKERVYSGNIMKVLSLKNFKQLSLLECRWPFSSGMWRASHWQSDCPGDNSIKSFIVASSHVIRKSPHGTEAKKISVVQNSVRQATQQISKTNIGVPRIHSPNISIILTSHLTGQRMCYTATTSQTTCSVVFKSAHTHIPSYHPETLRVVYWPQCVICGLCHSVTVWLSSSLSLYSR